MARTQTMVQLSDDLLALLDREAARRGISRSALVRQAIEGFLQAEHEAWIGQQIVDGYTRIPQGTPDDWGDLSEFNQHATADLMRRLDAEERAAGYGSW